MRTIKLVVAYDGSAYHGFQKQKNVQTVQNVLEDALTMLCGEPVVTAGSGRTDAGVHALAQTVTFTTNGRIPCANLVRAAASLLPEDIVAVSAEEMPEGFHARFSAQWKTYHYKLLVNEQEVTMKQFRREAKTAVSDFLHEVNHKLMGDFVSMSNEEIWRFQKMEKLLESKISRRFKVRRLDKDDFGYLIEHLYGQTGTAYEDYEYYLPKKRFQEETLVKYYDLIQPTRCLIEENQRYLKIEQEDGTVYACLLYTSPSPRDTR